MQRNGRGRLKAGSRLVRGEARLPGPSRCLKPSHPHMSPTECGVLPVSSAISWMDDRSGDPAVLSVLEHLGPNLHSGRGHSNDRTFRV